MITKINQPDSQFFQSYKETKEWLDEMKISNYSIRPDTLIVDVDGNVDVDNKKLAYIPVQFGRVKNYFSCSYNKLTSLKGSPEYVKGHFYCQDNQLTSLEYCPNYAGRGISCYNNPLRSLEALLSCEIKGKMVYTYNNNLSLIFECKEFMYDNNKKMVVIPFIKLKELLMIEQEQKLLQNKISVHDCNKITIKTMIYTNKSNKIKI